MELWGRWMDQAGDTGFAELGIVPPCCGAGTSLQELDYYFPAGFARYVIEIADPDEEQVRLMEQTMQTTGYRIIRAHY